MSEQGRLVAGRYRLRERIGGGGMGAVWLARDERLGREVAVKQVLPPSGVDDEGARQQRERALREGRIAARLSHPHAISVYDVALENDQPWLVMEYLPSRSLSAVLAEEGVLRADQVAQIGAQVADALAATHAAGIVHRDVKPANILIGQGGRVEGLVKITDFGISHASGDVTLTQTGQITGTPAYLAPEVARGFEQGPPADIFSLGATLYTCLEGQPPFGVAGNSLQQLHRVAAGEINPPARSGALTRSILRMLSVDPTARPSMTEVRDELAELAAGSGGDTTTVLTARTDVASSHRDRTSVLAAGAVGAGAGAASAPDSPPSLVGPPPAVPPPAPPPETAAPTGGTPRRRVPRTAWLAAAVLAAMAGLVVFWALVLGDPDGTTASPETPATSGPADPTADGAGGTDAGGTEAGGTEAGGTDADTGGTDADAGPGTGAGGAEEDTTGEDTADEDTTGEETTDEDTAGEGDTGDNGQADAVIATDDVEDYLDEFHELVISDPDAAYGQAGPTLRNSISLAGFRDYWGRFEDVQIRDVQVEEGGDSTLAVMEFRWPDGSRQVERHRFTFVERDGRLVLDSDRFVEMLEPRA